MKRLTMVLILLLCMVCAAVACGETSGDFEYEVLPDGTVEITDYTGDDEILTIPAQLDGRAVTSIGYEAFYNCSSLTSITIPDSVTSIGEGAFSWCSSLTSITIPDSVQSIGQMVFYGCDSLPYADYSLQWLEDSFVIIGYSGDETELVVPAEIYGRPVTSIGDYAFSLNSDLTSITIPDGVTSIGSSAFWDCSSLTSITIPDSVTSIGDEAFYNCSSLTSITIPDGVTSIGDQAFEYCSSLTSITIPDSVQSIGQMVFYGCDSLPYADYSLQWLEDSVVIIGYSGDETELVIPAEIYGRPVTSIGEDAFGWCVSLTSVIIPNGVMSIGDMAFWWCNNLTSITIPDSVTSIGEGAFEDCDSLTAVIVTPGSYAEQYCKDNGIPYSCAD